jgi:hypothetical protein
VRCDPSTMTKNDLDNGRLVSLIGVAVVKPAEFVIFCIGQWTARCEPASAAPRDESIRRLSSRRPASGSEGALTVRESVCLMLRTGRRERVERSEFGCGRNRETAGPSGALSHIRSNRRSRRQHDLPPESPQIRRPSQAGRRADG